jgi:DNA-binding transcriptional LysR family regulator
MGGECDRLSVACSPWAELMAVPRILRRFSELHRQVHIEIQTLNSVQQLRAVKTRTVDVGFMCPRSADKDLQDNDLRIERLVAYPLVVALPSNHRLAARAYLSPRDLAGESYVMLAADVAPAYTGIVTGYWEKAGVAVKERLKADQPHAMTDLVAAGAGFALVPLSAQEYEKTHIVCRRLDPAPPKLELSLAWARGVESPAINALLEVARQVGGQPKSHVSGESRADSPAGGSGLSESPLSRVGDTGDARTNGAHQLGAGSSPLRAPQLARDGGGKSIRTTQARDVRVAQAS